MSKIQAQFLYKYNDYVFIYGIFCFTPKSEYQVIVIRIYNILEDVFHMVEYGLFTNKEMPTYIKFF